MKRQSNLFDNDVRIKPLKYKEIKRLQLKDNESKEFLTASERVITVTKKNKGIQGVTSKQTIFYQICDAGKIIEPLTAKGVKRHLKTK